MDARRLFFIPFLAGIVTAVVTFGPQPQTASAEVPAPQVSPYLRAAIRAEAEARGYRYAGDFKFDAMFAGPGDWVSSVQSVGYDGAVVTYGRYASDEIVTTRFVRKGEYGWVNSVSGVGSPERVPALAAQPGPAADSWTVEGIDFAPGNEVAIFDGSAGGGEVRVPTDHVLITVKTDATGYFKAVVQLEPMANPLPGQTKRLLLVTGGAFVQVAYHHAGTGDAPTPPPSPTQPSGPTVPSGPTQPAAPTPAVPNTGGTDDGSNATDLAIYGAVAFFGVASAAALGVMVNKRRQ